MRIFSLISRKLTAVIVLMAVCAGVAGAELSQYLPPTTAIILGVDVNALRNHHQGAILFDTYMAPMTDAPLERIAQAWYGCDALGKRRSALVEFDTAETVEQLCAAIADKKETSGEDPAYILRERPEDTRIYRMYRLSEDIVGLFWRFPDGETPVGHDGLSREIREKLPRRSGGIFFVTGFPRFDNQYLKEITQFEAVLENGVDGDLLFHGTIVCKTAGSATMALFALNTVAGAFFESKYHVPAALTAAAMQALAIRREGNVLRFSTRSIEPVAAWLAALMKDVMPDYRMVIN